MSDPNLVIAPAVIAVLAGALTATLEAFGFRRTAVLGAIAGLGAGVAAALWAAYNVQGTVQAHDVIVGGEGFSATVAVVLALAVLSLVGGWSWFVDSPAGGAAASLVVLSSGAAAALAGGIDIVFILITLECLAIAAYALVSQARTPAADEAAMKYLIQGAAATGLMVLGVAILMGVYGGSTALIALSNAVRGANMTPLAAVMALVLAGFAYKLGAFPFHSWAPDAFETAPPASAAYMAAAPKVAAVLAAFIISSVLFSPADMPMWSVSTKIGALPIDISVTRVAAMWAVLAAGSVLFGNLAALRQESYGRMLGYSGIAQVGYALIGLTVGERVAGSTLLLVSLYGLAVIAAFLGAEYLRQVRPRWDGTISGMAGLGRERPLVGVALAVAMFSLTGIPLTAGFWGKLLVFGAAAGFGWEWLVVLGVLGSVVSFGYYGRVLKATFFEEVPGWAQAAEDAPRALAAKFTLSLIGLVLLVVGIAPLFAGLTFVSRFFVF